jgi:hypothetical protein
MDWHVKKSSLADEVSYFDPFWSKLTQAITGVDKEFLLMKTGDTSHETEFNGFELVNSMGKSAWVNWPSRYRFMGV